MKQILFMRHAKADTINAYTDDFDRGLVDKGRMRTEMVVKELVKRSVQIDYLWVSSANRTMETAEIANRAFKVKPENVFFDPSLYHDISTAQMFEHISNLSDELETIMIIGHNPTISYAGMNFAKMFYDILSTSAVYGLQFDVNKWSEITLRSGNTLFYINPKALSD